MKGGVLGVTSGKATDFWSRFRSVFRCLPGCLVLCLLVPAGVTTGATPAKAALPSCSSITNMFFASAGAGSCTQGGQTVNFSCSSIGIPGNFTTNCSFTGSCTGGTTFNKGGRSGSLTCSASIQNLAHVSQQASFVGLDAVQTHITNVRNSLQRRWRSTGPPQNTGPPLGFAADAPDADTGKGSFKAVDTSFNTFDNTLAALAYLNPKRPMVTKTPPAAPAPSRYSWAGWAQGFVDYEDRSATVAGMNVGLITTTGGGLAGIDLTTLNLTSATDALVTGILTGTTSALVRNGDGSVAHVDGPAAGAYAMYVNGGFSLDGTFKTDFFDLSQNTGGIITDWRLNNYTAAGNINYKQEFGSWWAEPTVGASQIWTVWDGASRSLGMTNGTDTRITGGIRWGTGWQWSGLQFNGTLSTFLYDDVIISGGTLVNAVAPLTPTDAGKIFGQLIGKLETNINGWSGYLEGEVRGTSNVVAVGARVGVRYSFN